MKTSPQPSPAGEGAGPITFYLNISK